jgi:hypothetical protein
MNALMRGESSTTQGRSSAAVGSRGDHLRGSHEGPAAPSAPLGPDSAHERRSSRAQRPIERWSPPRELRRRASPPPDPRPEAEHMYSTRSRGPGPHQDAEPSPAPDDTTIRRSERRPTARHPGRYTPDAPPPVRHRSPDARTSLYGHARGRGAATEPTSNVTSVRDGPGHTPEADGRSRPVRVTLRRRADWGGAEASVEPAPGPPAGAEAHGLRPRRKRTRLYEEESDEESEEVLPSKSRRTTLPGTARGGRFLDQPEGAHGGHGPEGGGTGGHIRVRLRR